MEPSLRSPNAPWAHLPEEIQEAMQVSLAKAIAACVRSQAAACERRSPSPQKRDAGGFGPPASARPR